MVVCEGSPICVCMCVCVCVRMYVHVYVCICVYVHEYVCVCMYLHLATGALFGVIDGPLSLRGREGGRE